MEKWSAETGYLQVVQTTRMRLSDQQIKDRLEIRPLPTGRGVVYCDLMRCETLLSVLPQTSAAGSNMILENYLAWRPGDPALPPLTYADLC